MEELHGGKDFQSSIKRSEFEDLAGEFWDRATVRKALFTASACLGCTENGHETDARASLILDRMMTHSNESTYCRHGWYELTRTNPNRTSCYRRQFGKAMSRGYAAKHTLPLPCFPASDSITACRASHTM